jgi:hypothetical protein
MRQYIPNQAQVGKVLRGAIERYLARSEEEPQSNSPRSEKKDASCR